MLAEEPVYGEAGDSTLIQRWLRKKPIIESIIVEGNNYFSDGKIKRAMFSRESNIFRAIKAERRRRVQKETILRDTSEIKYLYLTSGFLGVRLTEKFEPIPPDSGALVRLFITEGRQFICRSISLEGNLPEKIRGELNGIIGRIQSSRPIDPFKIQQAVYDCRSYLANNGFPYARVEYSIDTAQDNNLADVAFAVDIDSLVHFGELSVVGADYYDSSLAAREITFKKGDLYRRREIIESQKRILGSGYYLTLQLQSSTVDTGDSYKRLNPDFVLNLKEKKPHYLSIKTGAGQDPYKDLIWDFSAGWGKRNFFKSRRLELSASSSFVIFTEWRLINHSYSAKITEPWFLGLRMPLTLTGTFEPGVRSRIQQYRIQTWSISLETYRELKDLLKISGGFKYMSVNIYGLSEENATILRQEKGISIRQKLYFSASRDSRNNPFIPTKGSLTSGKAEYAGGFLGGDESYVLAEASWSRYQRAWLGMTAASRLKMGYVREFGAGEVVPVDVRYYIGGANSVRGFSENGLGPKSDDGTPEGANILLIGNQEFRFPLIGKLWASVFADGGNGFKSWSDIKWDRFALSLGAGLQFISPAGPIRFDYAERLRTKSIEPGHHFHFTILYAF
jgi:outer membrane protein insertion porin family